VLKYSHHFQVDLKNQFRNAEKYLFGLTRDGLRNKSIERIGEADSQIDYQSVQHFISDSPWSARNVIDNVALDANELLGSKDTGLIIDECGFKKKGSSSVGVQRQYLGSIGKVENGQVGVFGSLCKDGYRALIDTRLYLPEEWIKNSERLDKAKVPDEHRVFKTKNQIAFEIIESAKNNNLKYGWIGGDAFYGKSLDFMWNLDDLNEKFVLDVHSNTLVFQKKPNFSIPEYTGRGRKPVYEKSNTAPERIDNLIKSRPKGEWRVLKVRKSTKGYVRYEYLLLKIWLFNEKRQEGRQYQLIARRDPSTKMDYKYSISNFSRSTSLERLAYMQASRYWVERTFEDAKQSCGMGDYQVRSWLGWHHHMALVAMSMLFMVIEKKARKDEMPLLSCTDITEIISYSLSQNKITENDILSRIKKRHGQRKKSIEFHMRGRKPRSRNG
jgi:SRSO17 transposase